MKQIIINRILGNIGWSDKLNFYDLKTKNKLDLKSYNGCLCLFAPKRVGYRTFVKKSLVVSIPLEPDPLPF